MIANASERLSAENCGKKVETVRGGGGTYTPEASVTGACRFVMVSKVVGI